jgi:hypothetical protein
MRPTLASSYLTKRLDQTMNTFSLRGTYIARYVPIILFLSSLGAPPKAASGTTAEEWSRVPFANVSKQYALEVLPCEIRFRLSDKFEKLELPARYLPIQVVKDASQTTVIFAKRLFGGETYTFLYQAGSLSKPFSFPRSTKQNIVFKAFALNEYIYYISYNVISLRHFLQRLKVNKSSVEYDEQFILPLTFGTSHISNHTIQIDVVVRSIPHYNTEQAYIAGGDCVIGFHEEVTPQLNMLSSFEGYTFSKSTGGQQDAVFVFRRDAPVSSEPPLKAFSVNSQAEVSSNELLDEPFRMPNGLWNLGDNNYEGLVVWSQVYYLNGFINLLKEWANAEVSVPKPELQLLRQRLDIEVFLLDQMIMETDLVSFRYSMKRAPLFSSLHAARVHRLFRRYREEIPNPIELSSEAAVADWLDNLSHPQEILERVVSDGSESMGLAAKDLYLGVRRGVPFFHDGVNAPWNFITSHIGELSTRPKLAPENVKLIRDSIKAFIRRENFDNLPRENHEWHYNWGRGKLGRLARDNVSINRPNYPPDTGVAHISYRTMDLIGLLSATKNFPETLPKQFRSYALKAVAEGGVWPFVYEELDDCELPLDDNARQFWLLYSAPYEFQAASIAALRKRSNPKAIR